MTALISWGACIVLLPVLYALNANEAKFKKNIVVGVTFPIAGRADPEVLGLLKGYKRSQLLVCLGLAALAALFAALYWPGINFCLLFLWFDLLIVGEFACTARWNGKLKAVKKARGWAVPTIRTASVTAAAEPVKRASLWWFAAAALIAAVPALFDRELWWMYILDGAVAFGCGLGAKVLYRNRAEAVDENEAVTAALTRVRRRAWDRVWLLCAWTLAALDIGVWASQALSPAGGGAVLLLTIALAVGVCAAAVAIEFRVRHVQEKLTAASGQGFYVDEDDRWLWGQFYYDPNDSRTIINARTGVNSTVNLARPGGKAFMVLSLALLLALPVMGLCVDAMCAAPEPLRIEEGMLLAESFGRDYALPLEDIADAEVLDALPKGMTQVLGTGADSILKGAFTTPWGRATLCLDPRTGPWLKVTMTDGTVYLLGGGASDASGLYERLSERRQDP